LNTIYNITRYTSIII